MPSYEILFNIALIDKSIKINIIKNPKNILIGTNIVL